MKLSYEEIEDKFKELFESYPDVSEPKYKKIIDKMKLEGKLSIYINFDDIIDFNFDLSEQLLSSPEEVFPAAIDALKEVYGAEQGKRLAVRITNLPITERIDIKDIRAVHINKLIQVEGVVRRTTEVKPEIIEAVFECERCGDFITIYQDSIIFKPPITCSNPSCGRNGPFKLMKMHSTFVDWQSIKIQEKPEKLRGGQLPRSLDCTIKEEIVDTAQPGNVVTIVGILKTLQEGAGKTGGKKTTFSKFLEVNSIEIKEKDIQDLELSEEDEEKIRELASDPKICENITNSIAPSIYGNQHVKYAVALQLFSSEARLLQDGTRIRGDSHILLVGDPGVAKSQILKYMNMVAPRSIYTSGKGTSAAGLTAAVIRDETSGTFALEAGALVIADNGIACIDEIDKMSNDDRSSIHEAMEQQTVSIAKAGIIATLNARASILAAANPKRGRFDSYKPLGEQIDLLPTLLSRFDLIFILTDKPKESEDKKIAEHILKLHSNEEDNITPPIETETIRKYAIYSKKTIQEISLTDEAKNRLLEFYVSIRKKGEEKNTPIPITARQLESLIRLSEARARMRLSDKVMVEDVEEIIQLYMKSIEDIGKDPETGEIDIDMIMTGRPKSQRDKITIIMEIISNLDKKSNNEGALISELYEEARAENISDSFTRKIIDELKQKGDVYEPRPDRLKLTLM
ncbi:MAG: Minichromosome maintenance protein MCM [Candidatus Methanofastidiosum methylothiophilum]|uniref:DNA helicase n=1 Tax=Candidatus Methanofastidiosum methylothiophilum TaxID=1705564 RepID=A0A150J9W3_9EURY|nr:MAG: Minichromosome maintenance protein MCM [Candidatus Methanofastidiosum methylthiophilus]NMC76791.1 minichromosome maintenance protein MCM [Candidatus Methanofastidiosa archaeon]